MLRSKTLELSFWGAPQDKESCCVGLAWIAVGLFFDLLNHRSADVCVEEL